MGKTYKVPMKKIVPSLFLTFVAVVTAGITWSFQSGLLWTGICLIAVGGPLFIFYWYMIYITPKRASITITDDGIVVEARPFTNDVIPWASITKTFTINLDTDPRCNIIKSRKIMNFAGYRAGQVLMKDNCEAVIVSMRPEVLCLETEDRSYFLGPADFENFTNEVAAFLA